jgi:hypothetical protein
MNPYTALYEIIACIDRRRCCLSGMGEARDRAMPHIIEALDLADRLRTAMLQAQVEGWDCPTDRQIDERREEAAFPCEHGHRLWTTAVIQGLQVDL